MSAGRRPRKRREGLAHRLAHCGIGGSPALRTVLVIAHRFGQGDDAPGRALPVDDAAVARAIAKQRQLGRPAADVEDERRAVARFEQRLAAQHGEARFLARRNDIELDPRLIVDPRHELRAVCGLATSLGGDRSRQHDAAAPQLVRADGQSRNGSLDGGIGETAGRRQAFAQAHDTRERVDDDEAVAFWPGNEQTAIVGTQVEGSEIATQAWAVRHGIGDPALLLRRDRRSIPGARSGGRLMRHVRSCLP